MASSPGMSARATSSNRRSPCDKPAASWILSGGIWCGSSFLKPPRNLGVGTKTVMPWRSASARSGRCGESGLTLMVVALFHGSISRSRAAARSAPAKFGMRPWGGNGEAFLAHPRRTGQKRRQIRSIRRPEGRRYGRRSRGSSVMGWRRQPSVTPSPFTGHTCFFGTTLIGA